MRSTAIIVTLSLLCVSASAAEVYRSIDAQGNVVYSDRPGDEQAVKVAIVTAGAPAPVTVARNVAARDNSPAEPDEATIAAAEQAQQAEDRAANCVIARQRQQTFSDSHRLFRLGEDGQRVYYNDAETSQVRMDAAAEVTRWCG